MTYHIYLYILVMALVSYAIRVLPLVLLAALFGASLFRVAVSCCAVVFVTELLMSLLG